MARVLFVHDVKCQDKQGDSFTGSVACSVAVATTSQIVEFATPLYAEEAIATALSDSKKNSTHLACFRLYRLE